MTECGKQRFDIFLVEDNPADVYLLRMALRNAEIDFELMVMEDGAEALAFVRQEGKYADVPVPDLAVLDLNLPKNDGLEVLAAIRASRSLSEMRVAILTSSSSPVERARVQELGIDQFITKPPDLEEFLRIGLILKSLLEDNQPGGQLKS